MCQRLDMPAKNTRIRPFRFGDHRSVPAAQLNDQWCVLTIGRAGLKAVADTKCLDAAMPLGKALNAELNLNHPDSGVEILVIEIDAPDPAIADFAEGCIISYVAKSRR